MKKGGLTLVEGMFIVAIFGLFASWVVLDLHLANKTASIVLENDCLINRLRIEEAKYQWALQNGKKIGDEVPEKEIVATLGNRLDCPSGGKYSYGAVGSETTCSIHKKRELARPR